MTAGSILAIDPGPERSAWVHYGPDDILSGFEIWENRLLLEWFRNVQAPMDAVVIEKVTSYGMAVGESVFETVRWAGRFEEAAHPLPVHRVTRRAVKLHLCGQSRAKDANVRQALIDRYGGAGGKEAAVGRKVAPGPLYGVSKDVWAALAVAVTWADTQEKP